MHEWTLQDAKNRFSEVVRQARSQGPQTVTVHGKLTAIVFSAEDYAAQCKPPPPLTEYLLAGPAWPDDLVELINHRAQDTGRIVNL